VEGDCPGTHTVQRRKDMRSHEPAVFFIDDNDPRTLELYQVAAGSTHQDTVRITRPSDDVGFFDQTSLSRHNVQHQRTVTEHVPMITIDSLFFTTNDDNNETISTASSASSASSAAASAAALALPKIAMIKIDVQGHEYDVLQGMTRILSQAKTTKSPKYILYEADPQMMARAAAATAEDSSKNKNNNNPLVAAMIVFDFLQSYGYNCQRIGPLGGDVLCTML